MGLKKTRDREYTLSVKRFQPLKWFIFILFYVEIKLDDRNPRYELFVTVDICLSSDLLIFFYVLKTIVD